MGRGTRYYTDEELASKTGSLPVWAQDLVKGKDFQIEQLRKRIIELTAAHRDSDVWISNHSGSTPEDREATQLHLPSNSELNFRLGQDGWRDEISVRIDRPVNECPRLYIRGGHKLAIRPALANAIYLSS